MSAPTEEEAQLVESLLRKGGSCLESQYEESGGRARGAEIQSWAGETTQWLESFL